MLELMPDELSVGIRAETHVGFLGIEKPKSPLNTSGVTQEILLSGN